MLGAPDERVLAHLRDRVRGSNEQVRARVRSILEQQLAAIDSPTLAAAIVQRTRELTKGVSEADRATTATRGAGSAVSSIQTAGRTRSTPTRLPAVLVETASQSVASTEDAAAVAEAAYDVLGAGRHRVPPTTEHGRVLLRTAAMCGLDPPSTVEARLFLALSGLPHPACASTSARKMSVTTTATVVNTSTSGRAARAHSGAIP